MTVQFYKATSNGVVGEGDMAEIAAQIKRVYNEADYVGSLVTEGSTGRPTEHTGPMYEPPGWWDDFWTRYEANSRMTREETLRMLRELFGPNYRPTTEAQLRRDLRDLEKRQPRSRRDLN